MLIIDLTVTTIEMQIDHHPICYFTLEIPQRDVSQSKLTDYHKFINTFIFVLFFCKTDTTRLLSLFFNTTKL